MGKERNRGERRGSSARRGGRGGRGDAGVEREPEQEEEEEIKADYSGEAGRGRRRGGFNGEKERQQAAGGWSGKTMEQMRDSWRGQASRHLREQLSVLRAASRILPSPSPGFTGSISRQKSSGHVYGAHAHTARSQAAGSHAGRPGDRAGCLPPPPDLPGRRRTGPAGSAIACCSRGRAPPSRHEDSRVRLLHKLRYYRVMARSKNTGHG